MKHRWMDAVKRSTSALTSSSPRSIGSSTKDSTSSLSSGALGGADKPPSLSGRRSFALALLSTASDNTARHTGSMDDETPEDHMDSVAAFVHYEDRCESVGECSVSKVIDHCMLQGGVHHTHMNILTYLGNPLRIDTCCYAMRVQWFRALGENDDFQAIPDASGEWFTPTADDIGAKILAKVVLQDEDVPRTKLLEYGPIKEDPEVRSKVELYLDRRSVLFMGLESLAVQDGGEHYPNNIDMRESWTLLIDDRRVRLTCESSLLPPFEGFYTSSIRVEIVRSTPNEFYLFLAENCFVHLRAESNTVRDIIVLTLRAFCKSAVTSELISEAITKGISPMLTIRTIAAAEQLQLQQQQQQQNGVARQSHPIVKSPLSYNLPWNRPSIAAGTIIIDDDDDDSDEDDEDEDDRQEEGDHENGNGQDAEAFPLFAQGRRTRTASDCVSVTSCDFFDDSVLQDAEALIGNAMKMGLHHQLHYLPKAPKRISITDIPDLQIIEAMVSNASGSGSGNNDDETPSSRRRRSHQRRQSSRKASLARPESRSSCDWRSRSSSLDVQASRCVSDAGDGDEWVNSPPQPATEEDDSVHSGGGVPQMNGDSIEDAIEKFQRDDDNIGDVELLRSQYVAIFCELQRELRESKARAKSLSDKLDEKTEENKAFKTDIVLLQGALSSVQIAGHVKEMVTNDLMQLMRAKELNSPINSLPQNFY